MPLLVQPLRHRALAASLVLFGLVSRFSAAATSPVPPSYERRIAVAPDGSESCQVISTAAVPPTPGLRSSATTATFTVAASTSVQTKRIAVILYRPQNITGGFTVDQANAIVFTNAI